MHLVAVVGVAGFVPYVAAKTPLGLGGTVAGLSARNVEEYPGTAGWLQKHGVPRSSPVSASCFSSH